jgi:hypothetical protein
MSDYFDYTTGRLTAGRTARASAVNDIIDKIDVGFAKLPSETRLKRGTINYAAAGGTGNALTVSLPSAPTAYLDGMEVVFKTAVANTAAVTINVNNLGIKDIRRMDGSALRAGDIGAGQIVAMRYNTTTGYFNISGGMTEGVGSMSLQNSTSVGITGGTIDNVIMSAPIITGGTVGNHIDATTAHGAVSTATASRIIARDSSGRAKVAAPSQSDDIAIKSTVDDHVNSSTPHTGILEPAFTKNTAFNKNFGTTSGTVCQGNDSRLDTFLPSANAVGSYVIGMITAANTALTYGGTYSGINVWPTGFHFGSTDYSAVTDANQAGSILSGTWQIMGNCHAQSGKYSTTLFVRIL